MASPARRVEMGVGIGERRQQHHRPHPRRPPHPAVVAQWRCGHRRSTCRRNWSRAGAAMAGRSRNSRSPTTPSFRPRTGRRKHTVAPPGVQRAGTGAISVGEHTQATTDRATRSRHATRSRRMVCSGPRRPTTRPPPKVGVAVHATSVFHPAIAEAVEATRSAHNTEGTHRTVVDDRVAERQITGMAVLAWSYVSNFAALLGGRLVSWVGSPSRSTHLLARGRRSPCRIGRRW